MNALHLQNPKLELELISALLSDNKGFFRIADRIEAEDFSTSEMSEVFADISGLILAGEGVNHTLFRNRWQGRRDESFFLSLLNVEKVLSLLTHANEIRDLSRKRVLFDKLEGAINALDSGKLNDVVDDLQKTISGVYTGTKSLKVQAASKVIVELLNNMKTEEARSTGFSQVDKSMSGGLERGKVYCFGARPKHGKSMMLGSIANNLRKADVKFSFIAAEMGSLQIMKRLMAAEVGTWTKGLKVEHAGKLLSEASRSESMLMVDAPRIKLSAIESHIAMAVERYGIEGFVLDYMQLVSGKDSKTNAVEHLENVSQTIAELCKKYNIWCLTACQINRDETGARGGDGILMAVDWLYQMHKIEDMRPDMPKRFWLEYMAVREGSEADIGGEQKPYLQMHKYGTHFMEIE